MWRADPVNGCLLLSNPLGMQLTQRWYCSQKGNEVADRTTSTLYPFPHSGPHHSCHLSLQAHLPFLPEATIGLKTGPFAGLRPEHFQENDDATELGFHKAEEGVSSTPTFVSTWRAVTWVRLREEKEVPTQAALFYRFS